MQKALVSRRSNGICGIYGGARDSDLLQVGEFFHQLFHSVAREEYGELGIVAIAFAHEDCAFAVFAVADALALFQVKGAGRFGDVHGWTGEGTGLDGAAVATEEAGDVVYRVALRALRAFIFRRRV